MLQTLPALPHPCDPPTSDNSVRIQQIIPNYRLPYQDVIRKLRELFGESHFTVYSFEEHFILRIPRALTAQELESLDPLQPGGFSNVFGKSDESADHTAEFNLPSVPSRSRQSTPYYESSSALAFQLPSEKRESNIGYISNFHVDSHGSLSSMYGILVSGGFTCNVYAVHAWEKAAAILDPKAMGRGVAIKRLTHGTRIEEFIQEYRALRAVTSSRHRNIVEFLSAFRYEDEAKMVYYNFSFPLAVCNLKQLFRFDPRMSSRRPRISEKLADEFEIPSEFYSLALNSLWSEFEGLANALSYLHDHLFVAHSDIKPSNILLYESSGHEPVIVAKLTDFGMAVNLATKLSWRQGSREAQSAWQYDAPEIRAILQPDTKGLRFQAPPNLVGPSPQELMSGDVWKLGSVFVELMTFLIKGPEGVPQFRKFITTTYRELTSDDISDTRFDDGKQVKVEVLKWVAALASMDPRAREIKEVVISMLSHNAVRPTALAVSQILKNSSICLHFDGMRYLSFTPSNLVASCSVSDLCKAYIEKWCGSEIDWRPFANGVRMCLPGHTRISWLWKGGKLHIDVPDSLAHSYKKGCRPLSCFAQPSCRPANPDVPHPAYRSSDGSFVQTGIDLGSLGKEPRLTSLPDDSQLGRGITDNSTSASKMELREEVTPIAKRIFWCVDKAWAEPRVTELCNLDEKVHIFDDSSLCRQLVREYNRVRSWKGRYLSWKSCLWVEFIRFSRTARPEHVVKIQEGLPPSDHTSYEYMLKKPEEVHMMIAAKQLIHCLHHPSGTERGDDRTLRMIPKRLTSHAIGPDQTSNPLGVMQVSSDPDDDWGIYARARFSLWKILAWMALLTVFGLIFVILWLVFVDKTDLQNAFVPYMFLATMTMVAMGIPQFLEVD